MQTVKLSSDIEIPILGFGVFEITDPTERERKMNLYYSEVNEATLPTQLKFHKEMDRALTL